MTLAWYGSFLGCFLSIAIVWLYPSPPNFGGGFLLGFSLSAIGYLIGKAAAR
jgi:hypothetical protein